MGIYHILYFHLFFPTQDIRNLQLKLNKYGDNFDGVNFDWNLCKSLRISTNFTSDNKRLSCGKILQHSKDRVAAFREKMGIQLRCFKIGVTSNPLKRFAAYLDKGYHDMSLVFSSEKIDLVHMLEAALISENQLETGCHNTYGSGGDGALLKREPPSPPYFVYVVGGRADQNRTVG